MNLNPDILRIWQNVLNNYTYVYIILNTWWYVAKVDVTCSYDNCVSFGWATKTISANHSWICWSPVNHQYCNELMDCYRVPVGDLIKHFWATFTPPNNINKKKDTPTWNEQIWSECNYLQWSRLPSVRQAISRIRHAPKRRILCTQTFPNTLHPTVSAYMHPTTAYMHPTVSANMHPKGADFAPKSLRIHAPESSRFSKFEKNVIWSRPYLDLFLRCLGVQGTP